MASRGINKVILIGNLGKDPEVKYTAGGSAVCKMTVATSESWTDKASGEKQERTEWHRVVIFGKLAEICYEHLNKGSKVYLEGKLQTRKWTDQSGQDRYTTEVVADEMRMLDSRSTTDAPPQRQAPPPRRQASRPAPPAETATADFDDSGIPF